MTETLTPVMQAHGTDWWVGSGSRRLKIGCGPINTLDKVFADPHLQARGVVVEMPHAATALGVKVIANPVRLSETPADYRRPPPLLGQHTDEVLGGMLGYGADKLKALRDAGTV